MYILQLQCVNSHPKELDVLWQVRGTRGAAAAVNLVGCVKPGEPHRRELSRAKDAVATCLVLFGG
jgi:hypothetical protein